MANGQVKRAHMIPESYMLPWADENGDVYVGDVANERGMILRTSNATVVKYAYRTAVLRHDREAHYAQIESRGIAAIRSACESRTVVPSSRRDLTEFMDMFIERGLYADQANLSVPVIRGAFDSDEIEEVEFKLGDMISLHRDLNPDEPTLQKLGIEQWEWQTIEQPHAMMTGDNAVIPISTEDRTSTVLFPLDPFTLLVVGDIPHDLQFSVTNFIAQTSRRWIIGRPQDAPEWVMVDDQQKRTRKLRGST